MLLPTGHAIAAPVDTVIARTRAPKIQDFMTFTSPVRTTTGVEPRFLRASIQNDPRKVLASNS